MTMMTTVVDRAACALCDGCLLVVAAAADDDDDVDGGDARPAFSCLH